MPPVVRPGASLDTVDGTTKEYFDRARVVVVVKCTGIRTDFGPGGNIFTYYTFAVEETAKGGSKATVQVRLLGGRIGDTTIPLSIDPGFAAGAEYVLMLGPDSPDGYSTVNPSAVYAVKTEPQTGRKVMVPGVSGIPLRSKASGRPTVSAPDWAFLDDFIYSVKQLSR